MEIADAIVKFLKETKTESEQLNDIKNRLKNGKMKKQISSKPTSLKLQLVQNESFNINKNINFSLDFETSKVIPKRPQLAKIEEYDTTKHPNTTKKYIPKTIERDRNYKYINFEDINESNYQVISKQIQNLEPSEIDEMVREEKTDKMRKTMRDRYFKNEKIKNDTFIKLQKQLQEPLQVSELKRVRKRKNQSQQPNGIAHSTSFVHNIKIGRGSKSPFREINEKKLKNH